MATMMMAFENAKRCSRISGANFTDAKQYSSTRNNASQWRRMAYTLASALAHGGLCLDGPTPELKAWMRLAECPFDLTPEHSAPDAWEMLAKSLAIYVRKLRAKEDNYKRQRAPSVA